MNIDKIVRWLMVAAILIAIKAFYVDDYLREKAEQESNISQAVIDKNETNQDTQYINSATGSEREEIMVKQMEKNETKKMPLDELGDSMAKHIKL